MNQPSPLLGIHHVTAITDNAQRNVDFYSGALGLRLVKKTVNFDDPGSYHLYYGDELGRPGTLLTFFVWPGAMRGRRGTGEPIALGLRVPAGSHAWWRPFLESKGLTTKDAPARFGSPVLSVSDPNGLNIELIENDGPAGEGHAIERIHSVTLEIPQPARSFNHFLTDLRFESAQKSDERHRFNIGRDSLDVVEGSGEQRGNMGAGTIHHVAFRTTDDASQQVWLDALTRAGAPVSPVMDRQYFHSIYFREPGGVLFEVATDGPGMAVDEPLERLGQKLMLPRQYEPLRDRLETVLPPIALPSTNAAAATVTRS